MFNDIIIFKYYMLYKITQLESRVAQFTKSYKKKFPRLIKESETEQMNFNTPLDHKLSK